MSRRIRLQIVITVISSMLVLGLMAYVAVTRAAVSRPIEGGAFIEGIPGIPTTLNPLVSDTTTDLAAADVHAVIFDGLVRVGLDGSFEPALAEKWEIDPSGMVYTFTLRPDVKWHDGEAFGVEDVLFTLRSVQGPAFTGSPSLATVWRTVLVERAGDMSIRCKLQAPFAPFLKYATVPIVPAHLLADTPPEQWANSAFSQKPVGTGPYRITDINADAIALASNRDYYLDRPLIDTITLRFYQDESLAFAALTRGEVSGLAFVGTGTLGAYQTPRGVVRRAANIDSYTVLSFNLRNAPFDDVIFRRQIAQAIDREDMIRRLLADRATRIDTPILPGWWAYNPDAVWYIPSKERAAQGLDTLGYIVGEDGFRSRDGRPLAFELLVDGAADRKLVADDIAVQLGAVGIAVTVTVLDADTLRQRLEVGEFDMALHGWQRLGPDPDVYELWHSSQVTIGRNYAGLQDQLVDDALSLARVQVDQELRTQLYYDFQQHWIDIAPSIIMYQPLEVYATVSDLGGTALTQRRDMPGMINLLFGRDSRFRNLTHWFVARSQEISGDIQP
ncbi:MAG: peptide ABC transporter substrate-binding protein [Chloroflexi bacterium]|nr:MAG: peptide ABC transporter substrate-binding protein [Chloroflexota bacterium]